MRLSEKEIRAIKTCSAIYFPGSKLYLFGSRADDLKKGGDIDLYIETTLNDLDKRKIDFLTRLQQEIGEQKIDLVINEGKLDKQIFVEAKSTGIQLMNKYQENLESIFKECDKHIVRINMASEKMQPKMPLTIETYNQLNDDDIAALDQFLFRFGKLQDAIGSRLFSNMLLYLGEDIKSLTMIDKLNRLEQINLLESKIEWQNLRELRNELSHQYEQDSNESLKFINEVFDKRQQLLSIYIMMENYYRKLV